jgi:hypothetical protein
MSIIDFTAISCSQHVGLIRIGFVNDGKDYRRP